MSRTMFPTQIQLTAPMARQKMQNASFTGAGELGEGDRGGFNFVPALTGNPYDSNDYVFRWRQYVHLYEISWEARKIVRLPVEDALRKQWIVEGIDEDMAKEIKNKLDNLRFNSILGRSLMLERLLGGCLTFIGVDDQEDDTAKPFNPRRGQALRFFNAIPVSRINRIKWDTNPLSEHYMRPSMYMINGENVHVSRCLVWDGEPLFDPYDFALTNFRSNLAGFGPSKLATVWDDIVKAVGTRQAAFQLIKTNNSIIAAVKDLQDLNGSNPGREHMKKLKEIANNLSLYRAAMVDADKVDITQNAASFGSVPELILTFIQVLSAASDIPATRFLGQAPGGLNATGESDLENYYNMIDAFQRQRIEPQLRKVYDIIGYSLYKEKWGEERKKLEFNFPPLWNESEKEAAEKNGMVIDNTLKMIDAGLLGNEKALEELNAKGVVSVELDETDITLLDDADDVMGGTDDADANEQIDRLRNTIQVQNHAKETELIRQAGYDPASVDRKQFQAGLQEEMEHTDVTGGSPLDTAKIVLAHLKEDGLYYSKLGKAMNQDFKWRPEPKEGDIESFSLHGMKMAIENPKGSQRSGVDKDGTPWSSILPAHYGYVKKTEGADGDEVDIYLGPHDKSELVFVVDQVDADTGEFDEHKCIFGALGMTQAKQIYLAGFSDGKAESRVGAITPMHVSQFKQWIDKGDTTKPLALEITNGVDSARSSGETAGMEGEPRTANPYAIGTTSHTQWHHGWIATAPRKDPSPHNKED